MQLSCSNSIWLLPVLLSSLFWILCSCMSYLATFWSIHAVPSCIWDELYMSLLFHFNTNVMERSIFHWYRTITHKTGWRDDNEYALFRWIQGLRNTLYHVSVQQCKNRIFALDVLGKCNRWLQIQNMIPFVGIRLIIGRVNMFYPDHPWL